MAESLGSPLSNKQPTWFSSSPSISTWSWFFILTYKWPFTNTPEKRETMTEVGNRKKKTDKFLFHKNLTPGTLQRSIFFLFFHPCSRFRVLVWMCLELQNSTQSHWGNKAQRSQSLSLLSSSLVLCVFSTLSRRLYSPVPCMCRRAMVEWVVTGWSSSSLYCSLDQYWDMSGSLPGTWTGTDTPGEMSPA